MAEYAMSDHEKRKKIQELLDAAKAVLKTGAIPSSAAWIGRTRRRSNWSYH